MEQPATGSLINATLSDLLTLSRFEAPTLLTRSIARLETIRDRNLLDGADLSLGR